MLKIIAYVLIAVLVLIGFVLYVGHGPYVEIPDDAALGQEYPAPDEARITEETAQLMVDHIAERDAGKTVQRDAHPYAHGCVRGTFTVLPDLPGEFRHGVFAGPKSYAAWLRYSNGAVKRKPDIEGDIRGMAVKLTGVPGPKLGPVEQSTQDFLLINHPVMPVGDPGEYLALFKAALGGRPFSYFFGGAPWNWKLSAFRKVAAIRGKKIPNMLAIRYWSTTPYRLGEAAVKYSARPCTDDEGHLPAHVPDAVPENPADDYLRQAMVRQLQSGGACFEFLVQPQMDPVAQPIEDPAVRWDETAAPFTVVARIEIPDQAFDTPAQHAFCENLTFNPWNSLEEHRPLGGINRVRKLAYERVSAYRLEQNGERHREPTGTEEF